MTSETLRFTTTISTLPYPQVLGSDQRGLHPLEDEQSRVYDDFPGVVLRRNCFVGAAVRLEGSRVHATDPGREVHGFTRCGLSGTFIIIHEALSTYIMICKTKTYFTFLLLLFFNECHRFLQLVAPFTFLF